MSPGPDPQHPDLAPQPPSPDGKVEAAVSAELDDFTQRAAALLDDAVETFLRNTGTPRTAAMRAAARTILLGSRDYSDLTRDRDLAAALEQELVGVTDVPRPVGQVGRIHFAGLDVRVGDHLRQLCAWCGHRLVDLDLARVAVPVDQPGPPATWPPGALVAVVGRAAWVVDQTDGDQIPPGTCHDSTVRESL